MALQIAVLQPGFTLGTSASAVYTVPVGHSAWVKRAVFANTSSAATQIAVSVTRSGGSALIIIPPVLVPAASTLVPPELTSLALNAGDTVSASAGNASVVNCFISGLLGP